MAVSKKSEFIAQLSFDSFFARHKVSYFWTFTFAENLQDKKEAERRFKKVRDLFDRKGAEYLAVWERQTRGAWHVHLVTDKYFSVHWLRPWVVARGFGQFLRVEVLRGRHRCEDGKWRRDETQHRRVARYITKYLRKGMSGVADGGVKRFVGKRLCKAGTTRFSWRPEENPNAMLYSYGRSLFYQIHRRLPTFRE